MSLCARVLVCGCGCVPGGTEIEEGERGMWRRAVVKKENEKKDLVSLVKRKESKYFFRNLGQI